VAVLPILLIGIFSVRYFENKHLETVSELLNVHAVNVSNEASEFLRDTQNSLDLVEKTLNANLLHDDAEINRYLQVSVDESSSFESIYLLNEDYRVTHLALSSDSQNKRDDYFGIDLSTHAVFSRYHPESGIFWSDTFLSTATAEPSVTLALPLNKGILLGTVSLKRISSEIFSRLDKAGLDVRFSLLDHNGVLIADSRPERVSQRLNLRTHPEIRDALDRQIEVSSKYHEDHSLLESVRLVNATGWAAYVSLPIENAMQALGPLRFFLVSSLSFAALFGLCLAFWLSRRMLKPILLLRDAVSDAGQGHYNQFLPPSHYDELEDLGRSFREMMTAVNEREMSLIDNRARYRDLVNSIDGIVWELELDHFRFTFISDQVETVLGYTAQQWLEQQDFWLQHVHDEDRERVLSFCAIEIEAKRDYDFEYRMIASDGRPVWLKDIVSVIVEDDKPVRLRGVMFDITERKEAELDLQEISMRLQLLINRMPFGCIMWDAEYNVELWNPEAEKIFGFNSAEVVGLHPYDFLIPNHAKEQIEVVFAKLKEGDALAHSVNANLTKDGREITCEWHNTLVHNNEGVVIGTISMVQDISQRVSQELALKESESRFRTVFQTNPDVVLISRLVDGSIVNVNEYCLKATGYSRAELIGRTSLDVGFWVNVKDREDFINLLQQNKSVENMEMLFRVKSGRERTGLVSARILKLNDELCALSVIRDITEMKDAETRLVRSESRFRSLISVMGEGLVILGFNGEVVQCNKAAERILGRKAEDIVGQLHDELLQNIVKEDGQTYGPGEEPSAITLLTGASVINQVMGIPRADGKIIWVQANSHALGLNSAGKPVAVVLTFADVSRLKLIETELRKSESHLQSMTMQFQGLLEAIPDQIMVLDKEMRLVWLNRYPDNQLLSYDRTMRTPCYEMPDVDCGPASGNQEPLCENCPIKKTFISGRTEESQLSLADGRTLALRAFPIFDDQGEVVNVIEIVQDVTESLKQREQSIRTGQLAALGELAAGVAHEINNPINGVINYAQLILNKAVAESREEELSKRIISESERVATIVRELLYFSRVESQQVEQLTVLDALNESLALAQNQLNKEGVDLQIQLPDNLPMINSLSHQVQRLFLNLISNARYALTEKYPGTDPNKILMVTGEVLEQDSQLFVSVTFRDHGTGISPELIERVMNPFVTTKAAGVGTGLGLSISHEIVQKHDGTLRISSQEGEYTEVVVILPAV
jgi:PAS domain S-box-containing protein